MENSETQYKNDSDESFIDYVFSKPPQEKGVIKLECGLPDEGKPFPKHMYEQLLQIFVEGLQYKWGDEENNKVNIGDITLENDYNSLLEGLVERDFLVDYVPITSDFELQIEKQLDKKEYSVLALSVVQFLSGIKVDFNILKRIKQKHPTLIIIGDSTQFMGSDFFDFNHSPFDVIIGSGYKWLLAGFGNAYISVSEHFLNQTKCSSQIIYEKVYAGHINFLGSASLDFSIKFLQNNDFNNLIKIKNHLATLLREELKELNLLDPIVEKRTDHSSIFTILGDKNLYYNLLSNGIRCSLRGKGVRVAVHFYNIESEIENLIKVLKKLN